MRPGVLDMPSGLLFLVGVLVRVSFLLLVVVDLGGALGFVGGEGVLGGVRNGEVLWR